MHRFEDSTPAPALPAPVCGGCDANIFINQTAPDCVVHMSSGFGISVGLYCVRLAHVCMYTNMYMHILHAERTLVVCVCACRNMRALFIHTYVRKDVRSRFHNNIVDVVNAKTDRAKRLSSSTSSSAHTQKNRIDARQLAISVRGIKT